MNERIRELAEQATLVETYTSHDGSVHEGKSVDLEKFAELIVKECARIADRKYLYSKEPNRWDSGFNISCEILEQFGILKDE
jgi:hypothetical protein